MSRTKQVYHNIRETNMGSVDENNVRFFRTLLILMKEGRAVLMYLFHNRINQSVDIEYYLNCKMHDLRELKKKNVISNDQWSKLLPKPLVETWDVGLIILLLRNVCEIDMLSTDGFSLNKNLKKMKKIRNNIQGHSAEPGISEDCFNNMYLELSCILKNLIDFVPDSENFAQEIEKRINADLETSLDPVLYENMKEQMREWRALEMDMNGKLEKLMDTIEKNHSVSDAKNDQILNEFKTLTNVILSNKHKEVTVL